MNLVVMVLLAFPEIEAWVIRRMPDRLAFGVRHALRHSEPPDLAVGWPWHQPVRQHELQQLTDLQGPRDAHIEDRCPFGWFRLRAS